MYDPEEACNESEANQNIKDEGQNPDDDKWAEVGEVCTSEKDVGQEEVVEVKVESSVEEIEGETKVSANSPRTRRTATAKNTPGPKAKRGRK